MKRYYYISDDLDELEKIEHELEEAGIVTEQIHILSNRDDEVARHHVHSVTSIMKKDLVHSTLVGAAIGVVAAVLVLAIAALAGWPETWTWVPFIFLAIVLLGFCTWEGGLWGIQEPNHEFKRFNKALDDGKHILFVDIDPGEFESVDKITHSHPHIEDLGTGKSAPRWIVSGQNMFRRFLKWAP